MKKKHNKSIHAQIRTASGRLKYRRYTPEKYEKKKENLPEGWDIVGPMKPNFWKGKRSYYRKRRFKRLYNWIIKYRIILGLIIAFLTMVGIFLTWIWTMLSSR